MVDRINATASYHDSELGTILYERPIAVQPGDEGNTKTPRIPIKYNIDSESYEALKRALGGVLKLNASAHCDVSIKRFHLRDIFYRGQGIGAQVGKRNNPNSQSGPAHMNP